MKFVDDGNVPSLLVRKAEYSQLFSMICRTKCLRSCLSSSQVEERRCLIDAVVEEIDECDAARVKAQ